MRISWILSQILLQCSNQKPELKLILHFDNLDGSNRMQENVDRVEHKMDLSIEQRNRPPGLSGRDKHMNFA